MIENRPIASLISHLVLVIEVQGARQILERYPAEAFMILLTAPSEEVQAARLRGRGDDELAVQRRVVAALEEVADGRGIAHATVVNDDLDTAVSEVRRILEGRLSGNR